MPKKPLKRKNRKDVLTTPALQQILTGHVFLADPLKESDLKRIYKKYKRYIMSLIGQNVAGMRGIPVPWGTRPAAWWQFDAPEPRRLVSDHAGYLLPGKHIGFSGLPDFRAPLEVFNKMVFETQFAYLKRLGLLLPGESEKYDTTLLPMWEK